MGVYINKETEKRVEAVKVPYNEWGDNPNTWSEVPQWLLESVQTQHITPVFKGEDYWYYEVKTPFGLKTANPDCHLIYFEGYLDVIPTGKFNEDFDGPMA